MDRETDPSCDVQKARPVVVAGVPWDDGSSFLRGAAQAPLAIRKVLHSPAGNLCTEDGRDLGTEPGWSDHGDLVLGADALVQIEGQVAKLLARGCRVLSLGGDHAITYPIMRAYGARHPGLHLVHLDAHPDLYHELDGNPYSHACPCARIMEQGLAAHLTQVGIRAATPHQRDQAARFGVEMVEMCRWTGELQLQANAPVYLTIDLDCLDPAFAPGVSHPEPGGLSTREVLRIVQGLRGMVVGADIVELNPQRDPGGITAAAAAKILKEVLATMLP